MKIRLFWRYQGKKYTEDAASTKMPILKLTQVFYENEFHDNNSVIDLENRQPKLESSQGSKNVDIIIKLA